MRHRQRRRAWRVPGGRHDQAGAHEVGFLAEILASIDPTLRPPEARRDVCGGAEQGLYGCIESASWYKVLRGVLER
jgi:hypothetical protein